MIFQFRHFCHVLSAVAALSLLNINQVCSQPVLSVSYVRFFNGLANIEKQGKLNEYPELSTLLADSREQLRLIADMKREGLADRKSAEKKQAEVYKDFYEITSTLAPEFRAFVTFNAILDDVTYRSLLARSLSPVSIFREPSYVQPMRFTESQKKQLDGLNEKFDKKLEGICVEMEDEFRSVAEEHYHAIREILEKDQWDEFLHVYGFQTVLIEGYPIFNGLTLNTQYSYEIDNDYFDLFEKMLANEVERANDKENTTPMVPLFVLFDKSYGFSVESKRTVRTNLLRDDAKGFNCFIERRDSERIESLLNGTLKYPDSLEKALSEEELQKLKRCELQFMLLESFSFGLNSPLLQKHLKLTPNQLKKIDEFKMFVAEDVKEVIAQYRDEFEGVLSELHEQFDKIFNAEQKQAFDAVFKGRNYSSEIFSRLTQHLIR